MNKPSGGCLAVFVALLLVVSLFVNGALILAFSVRGASGGDGIGETKYQERLVSGSSSSAAKVVVIDLHGLISGGTAGQFGDNMVSDIELQLRQAKKDANVKAVVLRIDSPGGEVTASDEIYHFVSEFRASKPVVVDMESVAASGGYYSAMGGSYIVANDLTLTGSIGVILETFNVAGLIDKIGVRSVVIKSGKMKDMLSPFREATPEETAYLQGLINESYDKFVGIVAKERKLDVNLLRNGIADGRVLSGRQAKAAGLIDETGYFDDAVRKARELGKADGAKVVSYQPPFAFDRLFRALAASQVRPLRVELGGVESGALPLLSGKLYFLPSSVVGR